MMMIGLTGGIGSGKTTVSDYLLSKGYKVIDADKIARELLKGKYEDISGNFPESTPLQRVVLTFGKGILFEDKTINRKKLGSLVFNDANKKASLEKIIHTEIFKVINGLIEEFKSNGEAFVFLDAPLLFEVKLDLLTNSNWLVDVDDEIRIERVKKRDNLSREEIKDRIRNQMPREEKIKLADVVINNSGSIEDLYKIIDDLITNISK